MDIIYLDNSATTVPFDEVTDTVAFSMREDYYNPSALYAPALSVSMKLREYRRALAAPLQVSPDNIVITSGGTESNNMALFGIVNRLKSRGRLVCSAVEHPSVYEPFMYFKKLGYAVDFVQPDSDGRITPDALSEVLQPDTALVSVMHVNNETGAENDIAALGRLVHEKSPGAVFHSDGVQAYCKTYADIKEIDLYSASAHKINGPKGIGLLYIKNGIELAGVSLGGGQEKGRRSGTENIPGIAGFAKAASIWYENKETYAKRLSAIKERFVNGLTSAGGVVNGCGVPHILNISFPKIPGEVLLHALESKGIIIAVGSACSSKSGRTSRIISAMGITGDRAKGAVRLSFSPMLSDGEADAAIDKITAAVNELGSIINRGRKR